MYQFPTTIIKSINVVVWRLIRLIKTFISPTINYMVMPPVEAGANLAIMCIKF